MTDIPVYNKETENLSNEVPGIFPSCIVTRSMVLNPQNNNYVPKPKTDSIDVLVSPKGKNSNVVNVSVYDNINDTMLLDKIEDKSVHNESSQNNNLKDFSDELDKVDECTLVNEFFSGVEGSNTDDVKMPFNRQNLITAQQNDKELHRFFFNLSSLEEMNDLSECYFLSSGVLMRKWRPPEVPAQDEWRVFYQIVVPSELRSTILKYAHESPMAGHLGISKTKEKILAHFYWPKLANDVTKFCKSCHICQVVGKPNQPIHKAPLIPIPVFEEPFTRILLDIVGPLPKTKTGNQYLLTIMDISTRFSKAIPIKKITSKIIIDKFLLFISKFGLPHEVQSDQGSCFMSNQFKQSMQELGIKHITSSAYHPESQGALERYHQTLKSMLKKYCLENNVEWDNGIPFLLFAVRDMPNDSLGFSPFELLFGHQVRGPLKLFKENLLCV